jgi:hypothetical protein
MEKRTVISLFQTAAGAWHLPSILLVSSWVATAIVSGIFVVANLRANRDDRIRSFEKEQQNLAGLYAAHGKLAELETRQRPRTISAAQRTSFIETTKDGPKGPVYLATRTALPSKEQEDFTMQLRLLLDEAGFGTGGSNIVNGFSTGVDPGKFLLFVYRTDTPPPYFSNVASAFFELGFVSPDVPIAINNPNAKEGMLYIFIPEK